MAQHGRGLICVARQPRSRALEIPLMVCAQHFAILKPFLWQHRGEGDAPLPTFAADRASTVLAAIIRLQDRSDLLVQVTSFSYAARMPECLRALGQRDAAVPTWLDEPASIRPASICEIRTGLTMVGCHSSVVLLLRHDIPLVAIADLIAYRIVQSQW